MYVSEVRLLVDSLVFRIRRLRGARDAWLVHDQAARTQIALPPDEFDYDLFNDASGGTVQQQTAIFDDFEALLAAWARLSLLLHPIGGNGATAVWRETRGEALRGVLDMPDDSLLANREFRDSWMHFDERLDTAVLEGWLGNRQQFVRTSGVSNAVNRSVRVIDVEALQFHYRTRAGVPDHVSIQAMDDCLVKLQQGLATVGARIHRFPVA